MENTNRRFSFDCTDVAWAIMHVTGIANVTEAKDVRLEIMLTGPGGGWPEITVCSSHDKFCEELYFFLMDNHMCWTDEKGHVHDYA